MSKKNSRKEKAKRREKNAWKIARHTPCPIPEDDYILHKGFVPNLPIFQNTAVATVWDDGKRFALRTKSQLLDFIEKTDYPFEKISGTSGKRFIHISVYYLFNDFSKVCRYKRSLGKTNAETMMRTQFIEFDGTLNEGYEDENFNRCLYCFRPQIVGTSLSKDKEEHYLNNPHYNTYNTLNVPFEEIDNLPDGRWTKDDFIKFAKLDESITPLRDDELENWFEATSKEDAIKEGAYETNEEGDVLINEYQGIDRNGKKRTFYQPRKTENTYLTSFHPAFFNTDPFCVADGEIGFGGKA